jgi:hypothetical protein
MIEIIGTVALCHPTKCHFYNIRPNVTRPNVTYAECHL